MIIGLSILLIITSTLLVVLILLHRGKGGGLSSLFGHSLLFLLGYLFGEQFMNLVAAAEKEVDKLKPILILCGLAAVVVYLVIHFLRRPVPTGDPKDELPRIAGKVVATMETIESRLPLIGSRKPPSGELPPATTRPATGERSAPSN